MCHKEDVYDDIQIGKNLGLVKNKGYLNQTLSLINGLSTYL